MGLLSITRFSLRVRLAAAALLGFTLGALLVWLVGVSPLGLYSRDAELRALRTELTNVQDQQAELQAEVDRSRELSKLDKIAHDKLNLLIRNLEADNGRLKQELAFFESFVPAQDNTTAISLKRLQVTRDSIPGQYAYRALLIQGPEQPTLSLQLQLVLKIQLNGRTQVLTLPTAEQAVQPQFKVELRRFARVEGMFAVPSGAKLMSVEMRLLEGQALKASSSVKL